jgi:hypothetical protein
LTINCRAVGLKSWLSRRREVRRGEKVPATAGTVANRLVEEELAALDGKGPLGGADGTEPTAVRAGLLVGKGLGLVLQEGRKSALRQALSGGSGGVLQGHKVKGIVWAGLLQDAAADDFSPAGGEVTDLLEFLR